MNGNFQWKESKEKNSLPNAERHRAEQQWNEEERTNWL